MPVQTVLAPRRGTASGWSSVNPILASGEMGLETDTKKIKFGDGTSAWNSLGYAGQAELDGKANTNHSHVVADLSDSTTVGRSLVTAADAAAARTAIGAGTSNLAIGTTSTTAKAGNWFPSFAEVTGTLSSAQLPPLAVNKTDVVASQAAMLALVSERGDMAIRTDNGKTYVLSTDSPGTLADWKEITASGAVASVAGKTGTVTLVKGDVGLGNVDNTSDASKPVSTAQQTALNAKEGTIAAGTTAQYWRGDKTWQTLNKASVGLSSVDNTSDAAKPVSTAQQTALNGKADVGHTHGSADILSIDGGTP
jgi:hypothetical protein